MRRKYDMKNKRNFIIILIISIVTIVVFSLFLTRYLKLSKIEYSIDSASVLMDANKNYFSIDKDAIVKMKWNGNYYLQYDDKNINLGKKSVIYNESTGKITLYGTFYKISSNGAVDTLTGENVISNSTDTSFYKIDDRRYLVVDRIIYNKDRTLETNNYLLVELDIQGNAKLSNNKVNVKTLKETTILTSSYSFDVANEVINFKDQEIDLKKIVGTTNLYKKDEEKAYEGESGSDVSQSDNNSQSGNNTSSSDSNIVDNPQIVVPNADGVINNQDNVEPIDNTQEIKNKTKLTSVVSVKEYLTSIDIDYVIYDPYNEYESVYVEMKRGNNLETIYLNKNNETLTIKDLLPDTTYHFKFYYTYINEAKEIKKESFEEFDATTLKPSYSMSLYRISRVNGSLTYKVNLQDGFSISRVNVNLKFISKDNGVEAIVADFNDYVDITGNPSYMLKSVNVSSYNIPSDALLYLTVDSVIYEGRKVDIGSTYTFSMGG